MPLTWDLYFTSFRCVLCRSVECPASALIYILVMAAAMLIPAKPLPNRIFARRIQHFSETQQSRRQWINLADIAEWCGNLTGKKDATQEWRQRLTTEAFQDLLDDAQANKFSRLLFLSADTGAAMFIDGAFLRERARNYRDMPEVVITAYVAKCWVSLQDARSWFIARAVSAPRWLMGSGIIDRRSAPPYGKKPKGRPRGTGLDDSAAVESMRELVTRGGKSIRTAAKITLRAFENGGHGNENSAIDRLRKRYAATYRDAGH